MKTTMRTAAAAGAMAVLLSACGGSPTNATRAGAGGPSYDGGFGMGSGNREEPADTTIESGGTTSSGSAERSGFGTGPGN